MKLRTVNHIIKEGFLNIFKNKVMSIASLGTVVATLLFFGLFYMVIANVNNIADQFQKQPELTVYSLPGLDAAALKTVEDKIKADPLVASYTTITQKEAFDKLKLMLAQDQSAIEGLDQTFLPSMTYIIKLKDPSDAVVVAAAYKKLGQIDSADYIAEVIDFKQKLQQWIALASAVFIGILVMISIFLISNDIKLAVEARRREIRIMKYVGATDTFIRLPFVIEGVLIGLFGAIISFFIIGYTYSLVASKLNEQLSGVSVSLSNMIHIIDFGPVALKLLVTYGIIGLTVGITGSIITIRKHLTV